MAIAAIWNNCDGSVLSVPIVPVQSKLNPYNNAPRFQNMVHCIHER